MIYLAFPSPKKLVSYFGLGTSIYQSADTCYSGRITKQGNVHARSALVQASQVNVKYPSPLRSFFRLLSAKKGRNKAIIAVASKLTQKEDYRYMNPANTHVKLGRLHFLATGKSQRMEAVRGIGCGAKEEKRYERELKR